MASLRARKRNDGSECFAVPHRLDGTQTPTSFDGFESALKFGETGQQVRLCGFTTDDVVTVRLVVVTGS
jgi:hypothetical protein